MSGISGTGRAAARAAGWLAVVSTAVYFASDVLEASHGGFTTVQLWLTLACEATLPAFVLGLYQVQRPQIGRLGRYGAVAYAIAFLYFTYTVSYALAHGTPDFTALSRTLNPAMTVFGAVMVAAGIAFGVATYRARVLPGWTGPTLASGVVLVVVTLGLPAAVQLTAVGVRDLAFIGMGIAALGTGSRQRPVIPPQAPPSPPSGGSRLPDGYNAGAGQASAAAGPDGIDLYWLPLGVGGHSVRWSGELYEALAAWHERHGGTSFAVGVPFVSAWFPLARRGLAIGVFGMGMGGTAISALTTVKLVTAHGTAAPFIITACAWQPSR